MSVVLQMKKKVRKIFLPFEKKVKWKIEITKAAGPFFWRFCWNELLIVFQSFTLTVFNFHKRFYLQLHLKWQFSVTNFWNLFSQIQMIFEFFSETLQKRPPFERYLIFFQLHRWEGLIYHIFSESAVSKWLSTWFMFSLSQILVFFCYSVIV